MKYRAAAIILLISATLVYGAGNAPNTNSLSISNVGGFIPVVATIKGVKALPANARRSLSFRNEASYGSIAVCASGVPNPGINAPGCYTLPSFRSVGWSGSYIPSDEFWVYATSDNMPVTVEMH